MNEYIPKVGDLVYITNKDIKSYEWPAPTPALRKIHNLGTHTIEVLDGTQTKGYRPCRCIVLPPGTISSLEKLIYNIIN